MRFSNFSKATWQVGKSATLRPGSSDYGPLVTTFHLLREGENTLFNIYIT